MAETSAGGWVRRDLRASASTRPAASASGACSASSGTAWASTWSSACATEINATASLPHAKMAAAAAALFDEPNAFDAHAAFDRFDHVVDREAGDRDRGERFHLDAGFAGNFDPRSHLYSRQFDVGRDVDLDLGDGQGMAQRDQFMGAFCGHDTGEPRGAEDIALFRIALAHEIEGLGTHHDAAFGDRDAFGHGFRRNIHHVGFAARAEMGQFAATPCQGSHRAEASADWRTSSARVAAATSGCRIRLSPTRKEEIPALASRARSCGANMPLSPTTIRPAGTWCASRSQVARLVSNVLRFRLLMPRRRDFRRNARASS